MSNGPSLGPAGEPKGLQLLAVRLANALGKPFGIDPFPRAFPNLDGSDTADRPAVFEKIYATNFWASGESRSGLGSESGFAAAYRRRLQDCLAEIGARRLFDAPCGDLNWILPLARDPAIDYIGGDISASLIADTRRRYPDVDLRIFDVCVDGFPDTDVWHCRDCLFHLPFADIRRALENFTRSGIPFALLTTHRALIHRNLDIAAGGFRYLDLERPPFSLSRPQRYLRDYRFGVEFPRYVGLWRREAIAQALERSGD